jgi:membrane protein implicated in regulation of membrane protease activity
VGFELPWAWFWAILAAVLIVGEIFTAGFFLLPFGIGAIVAAFVAGFGGGIAAQLVGFLIVSVPLLFALKRFADRVTEGADLKVAADRVLGKVGTVIDTVQPHGITGRVRLGTEEWRAESEGEDAIVAGTMVEVLRIDGTHLVVRPRGGSRSAADEPEARPAAGGAETEPTRGSGATRPDTRDGEEGS